MKLKYTLAALAATTLAANAAITLHGLANSVGNQSNHVGPVVITFSTIALGADTNLASIDLGGPTSGATAEVYFLELRLDADNDATTLGNTGGIIATSTGSALSNGTATNFSFTGVTLSDTTVYSVTIVDNAGTAITTPRFGLSNGDNDQGTEMFANGVTRYNGSFDAPISVNMDVVPEPSSTALLGLGGLALILRRRK